MGKYYHIDCIRETITVSDVLKLHNFIASHPRLILPNVVR